MIPANIFMASSLHSLPRIYFGASTLSVYQWAALASCATGFICFGHFIFWVLKDNVLL